MRSLLHDPHLLESICVANVLCTVCCYCIERQQLVADIERLTSDKADLFTRLQCYEEELKSANECKNFAKSIYFYCLLCHFSIDIERENHFRYVGNKREGRGEDQSLEEGNQITAA